MFTLDSRLPRGGICWTTNFYMSNAVLLIVLIQITYPESKKLNTSEFELVKSERFNNILVNFTMSTVHIPTNVYDQCM